MLGTLLELVEVDDGWEAAFEAAAGDAMLAVVVADPAAARRALAHLDSGDAHGAVLALGGGEPHEARRTVAGVGEPLRSHVRSTDDRCRGCSTASWRVPFESSDGKPPLDASLTHPDAVVVTDDGHRFSATGWRLGVSGGGATAAAVEDAQGRAAAARAEFDDRDERVRLAKAELAAAVQAEVDLARRLDTNDARFTASADALTRVQGERRETAAEVESVERAATELAERVERGGRGSTSSRRSCRRSKRTRQLRPKQPGNSARHGPGSRQRPRASRVAPA